MNSSIILSWLLLCTSQDDLIYHTDLKYFKSGICILDPAGYDEVSHWLDKIDNRGQ